MRSGSDQRPRGRFNPNGQPNRRSPRNQPFSSRGPDTRIRGSAHQIFERYIGLAREAVVADDRVAAENFYQHAEHYFRVSQVTRESTHQGAPPTASAAPESTIDQQPVTNGDGDRDGEEPGWRDDRSEFG